MHPGKYLKQSKLVQTAKVGSGHQTVTIILSRSCIKTDGSSAILIHLINLHKHPSLFAESASEKVKKKQSNVA